MTDTKNPNALPSALTYDDVRSVSPALEHYTKIPLLDGLWKRPQLSFYAGWPNAFSALPVVKEIFEKREKP